MSPTVTKFALSLLGAAVVALAGWVYTTGSRVTAAEVSVTETQRALQDIRQDVRDLRNALLGPRSAP